LKRKLLRAGLGDPIVRFLRVLVDEFVEGLLRLLRIPKRLPLK
jgi:hypothetical protein